MRSWRAGRSERCTRSIAMRPPLFATFAVPIVLTSLPEPEGPGAICRAPSRFLWLRGDRRDGAGVLKGADALNTLLAPHARLLHSTEGGTKVEPRRPVVVHP